MGKSLQLPYANESETNVLPDMVQASMSNHLVLTFWVITRGRFDCSCEFFGLYQRHLSQYLSLESTKIINQSL